MKNQKVKNATPSTYNGINFDSKLEMFCYQKLLENNIKNTYNEITYTLVEKYDYLGYEYPEKKTPLGNFRRVVLPVTYTPDFVIQENIIIECKGFADNKFPIKWKMFKKQLQDKFSDNVYLFMPKNQKQVLECIEIIKKIQNG